MGALVYTDGVALLDFESRREKCLVHREGVTALAFTHDGAELAISSKGAYDYSPIAEPATFVEIQIIDVRTGVIKNKFPDTRVTNVLEMAFTPAGALFAVVANPGPERSGVPYFPRGLDGLFLWDVMARKLTPLIQDNRARQLRHCIAAFAPDGDSLFLSMGASGGKEEVKLYSTTAPSAGRTVNGVAPAAGFFPGAAAVAFSVDGQRLAYGFSRSAPGRMESNDIALYDLASRKVVWKIRNFSIGGMSLLFLADGRLAALPLTAVQARLQADLVPPGMPAQRIQTLKGITIWNAANGKIEKKMDLPTDAAINLLVPELNALASLTGSTWVFRDLQTFEVKDSISALDDRCMPADAARLNLEMEKAAQSFSIHRMLDVSFLPGKRGELLGTNDDGIVYLWNIATGNELQRNRFVSSADRVAISEGGRTVAVAGNVGMSVLVLEDDGSYRRAPMTDFALSVGSLASSPDGQMLAFGSTDGTLGIVDVKNHAAIRQWNGHSGAVRSTAFSRDGTLLASSGDDLTLKLWNVTTGEVVQTLEGHKGKINALTFAAGPKVLLASGGDDSRITLWDVKSRRIVKTLKEHGGSIRSISFSPDGAILVSGADDGLRVWDVKTGKTVKILLKNSPEWAAGSGVEAGRPTALGGDDITVTSIRFSPDGRLVACGGTNNTAMVWDTRTWGRRTFRPIEK